MAYGELPWLSIGHANFETLEVYLNESACGLVRHTGLEFGRGLCWRCNQLVVIILSRETG